MKVLAFDLATSTGIAFGEVGGKPKAGSVSLGVSVRRKGEPADRASQEETDGRRYAKAISLCGNLTERFKPDLIAIEAPVGGANASAFLIGLIACVRGEATRRGIRVVSYYPSTVRKHFLGKALTARDFPGKNAAAAKKQIKGVVIDRCRLLGWDVRDGDAADAAALWDFACAMESRSHQMTSLQGMFSAKGQNNG